VPVVGDGKWIWTEPPVGRTGYLEPRRYRLRIGIELTGRGEAGNLYASTPAPIVAGEQEIVAERAVATNGRAAIVDLSSSGSATTARQLALSAPQLVKGAVASAAAEFELVISKQFFGHRAENFPVEQRVPADIRAAAMGDSPGIQTQSKAVLSLASDLRRSLVHPWHVAAAFAEWIPQNIRPRLGRYTDVTTALATRVGDCEEMAGVFVALCRAAGIPARLVWIPNHVWSEFYLTDGDGRGHWIPAHTACYPWFGWTGVHELILQKGDRVRLPGKSGVVRLQTDRLRYQGTKPDARYWAELTPLAAAESSDAGPGARSKIETGEWIAVGTHPLDKALRR